MLNKIEKLKKLKLLFVEDESDLIQIITETLDKLQADYFIASNGLEGLSILEKHKDIDVIVTDINMPEMNGLDMIEVIRKDEHYKNIEIIIMTAHTESSYMDRAKEYGVENYLLKPFDFIKFINLVVTLDVNKD